MFAHICRHELRLFRQNPSWWGSLVALGLLTILAAWNGNARQQRGLDDLGNIQAAADLLRDTLQKQLNNYEATPGQPPPAAANAGAMGYSILSNPVALPPRPLHALALGQSDTLPAYYPVTAHAAYSFMNDTEISNPNNLLAGSFDAAFVIVFVLPVFIIALSFDLLSGEKERGILALTLAHGVSLPRYTLAKCAAHACIVLVVALGITLLAFFVAGVDFGRPGAIAGATAWLGVVGIYALFWFALALFVNSLDRRSETNGILMANVWLLAVVVLPALANVAATAAFPAPSRVTLTTELREAASQAEERAAAAREQYFFDHPELAGNAQEPGAFFREVLVSEAEISTSIAPLLDDFERQARQRTRVVDTLQFLSPAILAQRSLTAIAGTDDARFIAFQARVRDYHADYQEFFGRRLLADQAMTAAAMEAIPVFEFREATGLSTQLGAPLTVLLLFSLLLVAAALLRFRRYPVLQPA